jgi:hypothetical protein
MTTNKDPIFLNSVVTSNVSIANSDGTDLQTVLTAGADGGAVTQLSATTTDTSAVIAVLTLSDGTTAVIVGEVTVPIGAGTDGSTPAKNLLDGTAMPGVLQEDGSLVMGPAAVLSVSAKVAVTAAKTLDVTASGGQYAV